MKKLLITSLCLALALTAAGCSGNDSKAINNLDAQLDRVNTVVSETSTTEVNSVSPVQLDYTQPSQIQAIRKNAYNNMMREEELRHLVLVLLLSSCCCKHFCELLVFERVVCNRAGLG